MCSINTAWLSVASSVAAMVVPAAHGARQGTELVAVSLAALFTVVGEPGRPSALPWMPCSVPRSSYGQLDESTAAESMKSMLPGSDGAYCGLQA